jgi:N-acetylmuramoyl-L-alanine amidase
MFMAVNTGMSQPAINLGSVDDLKEVACLSQAVHGEAGNQSMQGKIAVAHVIINRTKSDKFPADDVCGVVKQKGQFDFLKKVRWIKENKPEERKQMEESITAAFKALHEPDPTNGALYFVNPHLADMSWLRGLKKTVKIDDHVFYKPRRDM